MSKVNQNLLKPSRLFG